MGSVWTFAVDVGVEMLQAADFPVKISIGIPIKNFRAVRHISGTGDFQCGIGYWRADRTPHVKPDHHGFAAHNPCHFFPDFFEGIGSEHFICQRTHGFAFIGNLECVVFFSSLLFFQIVMDGVSLQGKGLFLAVF